MLVRSIAAAAALVLLAAPRPALAGPPWISVELPANPHQESTRGALAVVRLYHHGDPTAFPLQAEAVGMVDGARRTVRLEARPVGAAGTFAVRGALPAGEGWVLVMTMREGATVTATALVALDRRGDVAGVRVPIDSRENGRWSVPRAITAADVDAMLRVATTARVADAGGTRAGAPGRGAATAGLAAAGVGLLLRRRDRSGRDRSSRDGVRES
ncbi:hypothetical protein [Roseisolibacter sp. H3M3-2]|uniref:hypothetical protein n=1 Tax=Roseisolibacter sp. H3M3-2 TaxID=3031323 RepID=UPI0023DA1E50|nr:hypothetical protein [Roseisolibacter sp. H3M3-2]MDF1505077.1 hypothetical protein [Roseisolibacter sp. H3M3-2]